MKTIRFTAGMKRLASAAVVVLLATGVFSAQDAAAQIAGTKHNLGTGRISGVTMDATRTNEFSGTAEICVFCHTPHGSDASAAVPLWNRAMAAPTTYTTYNSLGTSSLDGATAPVGSVSLACLSCHDGTQAMNTVINQPGSGGYNAAGAAMTGTWTGTRMNTTTGQLTGVANLSQDLRNDHPIGIQYAGGPSGSIPAAGTVYNAFKDTAFQPAQSASLNGMTVWWVDTGGSGTREKTDMQLYSRADVTSVNRDGTSGAVISGSQPYVECASCHDPHTANPTFLRVANANSAVCLACHIK